MTSQEKWKSILYEWKNTGSFPESVSRETTKKITPWLKEKHIITLSGVRRSGKTTILFQLVEHLKTQKIKPANICYINLDNHKLFPLHGDELSTFLEVYDELFERDKKKLFYLFFDEIQNIPNWEKWIKEQYDKTQEIKFILSGSSAALVSSEFSTLLTGRNINFTIYPFSFREYLCAYGNLEFLNKSREELWYHPQKPFIKKRFNQYFKSGGFYEAFQISKNKRITLLQNYYRDIIHRDIIYRHQIRDAKLLEEIGLYLMTNIGNELSFNTIAKVLKTSIHTVKEYFSYFQECYLFWSNYFFSYSLKESLNRNRKIYCIDHGLRMANTFTFSTDMGRVMENIVFLELVRRGAKIHFYRKKGELDFIVQYPKKIPELIQVFGGKQQMPFREIKAFGENPLTARKIKKTIITTDIWKKEESIEHIPLWLWLLCQ